jgi:hypothetical protein
MADHVDPKLIADGLRFLAAGFDLAAKTGVPAVIRTLKLRDGGEEVCEREIRVRAVCADETLDMQSFATRFPHEFLLLSIGSNGHRKIFENGDALGAASFGGPPQDGSETYKIRRVELIYDEVPGHGFQLVVNMQLGEPGMSTFVHRGPVDQSELIYQARLEVEFANIFSFLAPITKQHAEEIRDKLSQRFGLQVDMPSFYVSKRNG